MGLIWSNYWLWKGWANALYERHPERRPEFRMRPDLGGPQGTEGCTLLRHSAAKPVAASNTIAWRGMRGSRTYT